MNCGSGGGLYVAAAGLGVEGHVLRHLLHHRARRCLGRHRRDLGVQLKRLFFLDEESTIDLNNVDGTDAPMEDEALGVWVGACLGEGGLLLDDHFGLKRSWHRACMYDMSTCNQCEYARAMCVRMARHAEDWRVCRVQSQQGWNRVCGAMDRIGGGCM